MGWTLIGWKQALASVPTSRGTSREGLGRFGMGLNNAGIAFGELLEVYSHSSDSLIGIALLLICVKVAQPVSLMNT